MAIYIKDALYNASQRFTEEDLIELKKRENHIDKLIFNLFESGKAVIDYNNFVFDRYKNEKYSETKKTLMRNELLTRYRIVGWNIEKTYNREWEPVYIFTDK